MLKMKIKKAMSDFVFIIYPTASLSVKIYEDILYRNKAIQTNIKSFLDCWQSEKHFHLHPKKTADSSFKIMKMAISDDFNKVTTFNILPYNSHS